MPVGVPRSGKTTLRIPAWLHEELAAEAFERNVSINQICFEALVARRALRGRPTVKRTLEQLDASRRFDRAKTAQAIERCVEAITAEQQASVKLDEPQEAVLEAVRELGIADAQAIADRFQLDVVSVHTHLIALWLHDLVVKLPGERFRIKHLARASPQAH